MLGITALLHCEGAAMWLEFNLGSHIKDMKPLNIENIQQKSAFSSLYFARDSASCL